MKLILIIVGIFLLSGCSAKKPSITEYKITTNSVNLNRSSESCKEKSLKVAQAFSSSSLMALKMNYIHENSKVFSYTQAQWSESPNHSITMEIVKEIRKSNLFQNVQISKSRSKSNLILETNIEDFSQYFSEDFKTSFVNVTISFTLIDSKTNSVISTKIINSKTKANSLDAYGGVEALNSALTDLLTQNIEWLNGVCK